MTEAPERIWTQREFHQTSCRGSASTNETVRHAIGYIRADIHDAAVSAARKEGVRVKALEWQMRVPRYSTGNKLYPVASWDDLEFFIGALALEEFKLPDGSYSRTFGCYCSSDPRAARLSPGPDGEYAFATEDEAKAAAQSDYESRILSALETTP